MFSSSSRWLVFINSASVRRSKSFQRNPCAETIEGLRTKRNKMRPNQINLDLIIYFFCYASCRVVPKKPLPSVNAEVVQQMLFVAPLFFYFYKQFQMTAVVQKLFDVLPGTRPDLFQTISSMPDNDL